MAQVEERIHVIICDHVLFARFGVEGEHNKKNLIVEKPVLEMAVKRAHRSIILLWNRRTLLEVNRKNREPVSGGFFLGRSAREAQQLKKLPAILVAITVVGEDRINKIEFHGFRSRVSRQGAQRRETPDPFGISLLLVKEWPRRLGPVARRQRQIEFIEQWTRMEKVIAEPGCRHSDCQGINGKAKAANPGHWR